MFLRLEICIVCMEFLASKYVYHLFQNKSDDYLYLYIRNLKNRFFGTHYIHLNLCGLSLTKVNGRAFKFGVECFIVTKNYNFLILFRLKKCQFVISM